MRYLAQVILAVFAPVHAFLVPSSGHYYLGIKKQEAAPFATRPISTVTIGGEYPTLFFSPDVTDGDQEEDETIAAEPERDTIRVRIWRALASGDELSMTQLCKQVGERSRGDLRSHLTHVERQAKTIRNKSNEWRVRRGLSSLANMEGGGSAVVGAKKLRLKMRKGKNELFIRLV
mmetsp:Transcript_1164/g.2438  ORF Transcript_1164/g.2438 Transcript_1164/m.2438 type:complete len:175 (-) Transcript_1164:111-635(-)|eukprot:CAMPEP_0172312862 /NCGR_PEP_ID=MMETSP1058-20130122/18704_1 /TAXON_ID=83371 /ORGANISM="Detonula confervacea, Strain CCMP 353" /LENGTH=174 /DNA_ID=CAMNT_0013026417 /DNA_START=74 /DNA_END=598 /DNA_ORIENTATION=-